MPTTRFTVHTSLSPSDVLGVLTDFGPDWAEVTEGNAMGWERERYSWDVAAGTMGIDTLNSNLWGAGTPPIVAGNRGFESQRQAMSSMIVWPLPDIEHVFYA
jgi:hypothetical protein